MLEGGYLKLGIGDGEMQTTDSGVTFCETDVSGQ